MSERSDREFLCLALGENDDSAEDKNDRRAPRFVGGGGGDGVGRGAERQCLATGVREWE